MRPDQIFSLAVLLVGLGLIAVGLSQVESQGASTEGQPTASLPVPPMPVEPAAVTSLAEPVYFGVERVVDGDTFIIQGFSDSVRLIGIDTPEMGNQFGPRECYALEATRRLQELVEGKEVELKRDVEDRDRYHRPTYSFPSDHAGFLAAMTVTFYLSGYRKLAQAFLVVTLFVSLGRVMIGFHWPTDIIGGWLVGAAVAYIVHASREWVDRYLSRPAIKLAQRLGLA